MALQCAAKLCFSSMVDMTWRSMAAAVSLTTRSKSSICTHDVLIGALMYTMTILQFCSSGGALIMRSGLNQADLKHT